MTLAPDAPLATPALAPERNEPAVAVPRERDSFFDNARFIMILFVVVCHTIEPLVSNSRTVLAFYRLILIFNMPLTTLISGHFAPRRLDGRVLSKLLGCVIVPYMVFETLYTLFDARLTGAAGPPRFSMLTPNWLLWYLMSLTWWRLLGPLLNTLRWPVATSVALAVGIGYLDDAGYNLSVSRTLVFLPFYMLGARLRREHFALLQRSLARVACAVLLVAIVAGFYHADKHLRVAWLVGSFSYKAMNYTAWHAGLVRLGHLGLIVLTGACVLSLMPRRRTFFTHLGTRTLFVYVLHGFAIKWALAAGLFKRINTPLEIAAAVAAAVALGFVLASRWVVTPLRPIMQPRMDWLFRRDG